MSRIKSAKATFDKLIKYSEILDKKGEFSLSSYLTTVSKYHAKLITSQIEEEVEIEEEEDIVPPKDPNALQPNPNAKIPEVISRQRLHDDLSLPYLKTDNIGDFDESKVGFKIKTFVWRSISVPFMKMYIHKWLFGEKILKMIYKIEEKFPKVAGNMGEYPLFYFEKSI